MTVVTWLVIDIPKEDSIVILETSNNINVSQAGTYKVKATNLDGCSTEKSVVMIQKCVSKIYAANIFTPNADGDNDIFWISTQDVPSCEMLILLEVSLLGDHL